MTGTVMYDGQVYSDPKDIPDLGSFGEGHISDPSTNARSYYGLSADVSKLPTYVESGSTAYCVDTGALYMFNKSNKTWYAQ